MPMDVSKRTLNIYTKRMKRITAGGAQRGQNRDSNQPGEKLRAQVNYSLKCSSCLLDSIFNMSKRLDYQMQF